MKTMNRGSAKLTRFGLEFDHEGDWVIWLWWWRRKKKGRFYSTSFCAQYETLSALDQEWNEFIRTYNGETS
jgi:hypothetical protein